MPRKFRRFFVSIFLVLFSFIIISAQTTGDVMRERITKAKAYIAVKNYNAAIYELEAIKRETNDPTVHGVVNVLLMNSYLEQGDYKRAQDLLTELSKSNRPNAAATYMAAAGQVVKGARAQLDRYKSLGLSVSDRNLPLEAATDVEKMRQTLELVIEQSKVLGKDRAQTTNAMALIEEASNARSGLAKDEYDANRWKNESADARELLANSRSVVMNVDGTTDNVNQNTVASTNNTTQTTQTNQTQTNTTNTNQATLNPVTTNTSQTNTNPQTTNQTTQTNNQTTQTNNTVAVKENPTTEKKQTETTQNTNNTQANTNQTTSRDRRVENNNPQTTNTQQNNQTTTNDNTPMEIGSLIEYAIQRVNPTYPQQARSIRQTGVVKVELVIDEEGKVSEIKKSSGPALLQAAARDAAQKWRFRPFLRDGQPVKATGFISFNFTL